MFLVELLNFFLCYDCFISLPVTGSKLTQECKRCH